MNAEKSLVALEKYKEWQRTGIGEQPNLSDADLRNANLYGANLYGANLSGANLSGADLRNASLYGAKLYGADLRNANLCGADLSGADLRIANLHGANLYGANLYGANLCGADLSGADLRIANLHGANLYGANLGGAKLPSPTMLLLADWDEVSDQLCIDLMRYDASNHPDPTKFDEWVKTSICPYSYCTWQRAANFVEKRKLWSPGPAPSALELATRLISEKCKQ